MLLRNIQHRVAFEHLHGVSCIRFITAGTFQAPAASEPLSCVPEASNPTKSSGSGHPKFRGEVKHAYLGAYIVKPRRLRERVR
jgi:hypothetical protein